MSFQQSFFNPGVFSVDDDSDCEDTTVASFSGEASKETTSLGSSGSNLAQGAPATCFSNKENLPTTRTGLHRDQNQPNPPLLTDRGVSLESDSEKTRSFHDEKRRSQDDPTREKTQDLDSDAVGEDKAGSSESMVESVEQQQPARTKMAGAWSFLNCPTKRDIAPKRRRLALDKPIPDFAALVVMDFEWTADNRQKMVPCAEIIQFPAVIVRFDGIHAPSGLLKDTFDSFVKPKFNPILTEFSKQLCAIPQEDVDKAPHLEDVISNFLVWLQQHGLVLPDGSKDEHTVGRWCFATWSDADIGGTLVRQLEEYGIGLPACFSDWVDLKQLFQRHYKHGPKGGLQRCVEYLKIEFEGRAHNGLVDAWNTAKIAAHMARDGFVFKRPTRAIDPRSGRMFGSRPKVPSSS